METFKIQNLTFEYPNRVQKALCGINLTVNSGEFITLCGRSGCGKTTLLRLLKTTTAPTGTVTGDIFFEGRKLEDVTQREQVASIGFVMQNPENQIATDKVWHELAFGAESLGMSNAEIRARVSEMASFFGIHKWFHQKVSELSGGQKQLLNLASVMVMQPTVLIMDEPTAQLDPIAASEFLKTVEKINRELGVTVILSEHRLEEAFAMSDRVVVLDEGEIVAEGTPRSVGEVLKADKNTMYGGLPTPMRVWGAVENDFECPLTVRDGRLWLERYSAKRKLEMKSIPDSGEVSSDKIIELRDIWFRYEKDSEDIIKGLNLDIRKGEILAVMGGNGVGKTTTLSVISGLNLPYRGKVLIKGEELSKVKNLYDDVLGVLPQDPLTLFVKKSVRLELEDVFEDRDVAPKDRDECINEVAALCKIEDFFECHPYDLSGGEQQRIALGKVLLKNPEILLMDEPTKGMDAEFKESFGEILKKLKDKGKTIVMISHDIEFCAKYTDRCALVFDGSITSQDTPGRFFAGKSFYTTSANRMARNVLPDAVLAEDIIFACGGTITKPESKNKKTVVFPKTEKQSVARPQKKLNPLKMVFGGIFSIFFIFVYLVQHGSLSVVGNDDVAKLLSSQWLPIILFWAALGCFLPKGRKRASDNSVTTSSVGFSKRTVAALVFVLIAVPATVLAGMYLLQDKKYYFISILVMLETLIPFLITFEGRKPSARELVIISGLCGLAVVGRAAFSILPQFKPMVAVVIIAGICFGGEAGFLVGAVAAFVSNFFAGQGSWTPWQMIACGMVGFVGGILFAPGRLPRSKFVLSVFGFAATFLIYGIIVDSQFVLLMLSEMSAEAIVGAYVMGIPFNLIHGVSTAMFLWFISEPLIEKLERVKIKYGLLNK